MSDAIWVVYSMQSIVKKKKEPCSSDPSLDNLKNNPIMLMCYREGYQMEK